MSARRQAVGAALFASALLVAVAPAQSRPLPRQSDKINAQVLWMHARSDNQRGRVMACDLIVDVRQRIGQPRPRGEPPVFRLGFRYKRDQPMATLSISANRDAHSQTRLPLFSGSIRVDGWQPFFEQRVNRRMGASEVMLFMEPWPSAVDFARLLARGPQLRLQAQLEGRPAHDLTVQVEAEARAVQSLRQCLVALRR